MSSSETLNNLNIRKFSSRSKLKAAQDVGVNDLCVVTDNSEAVLQIPVPPTPSEENLGEIYMATTTSSGDAGNFEEGYFYKCIKLGEDFTDIHQSVGSSLSDLTVNARTFSQVVGEGQYYFTFDGTNWLDAGNIVDLGAAGITYTGTPVENDQIFVWVMFATYSWQQQNTQPQAQDYSSMMRSGIVLAPNDTRLIALRYGVFDDGYHPFWSSFNGTEMLIELSNEDGSSLFVGKVRIDAYISGEQEIIKATGIFANSKIYFVEITGYTGTKIAIRNADGSAFVTTDHGVSIDASVSKCGAFGNDYINLQFSPLSSSGVTSATLIPEKQSGASYTAGNGINIDANNEISVADPVLVNRATGTHSVAIGESATAVGNNATAVGASAQAMASGSLAIGQGAYCTATNSIMICARGSYGTLVQNSDPNTVKIHNGLGKYEIMSADGTVPTARLTKVNTTATLAAANWSSNTQTVTVSGVKADSVVFVSPAPASASDYASAGILCTAQAADSLTFTATTTPSSAISVNIICL